MEHSTTDWRLEMKTTVIHENTEIVKENEFGKFAVERGPNDEMVVYTGDVAITFEKHEFAVLAVLVRSL